MGTQTHNSQSLHVYDWNKSAFAMRDNFANDKCTKTLYDIAEARSMDFDFVSELPVNRLIEIDNMLKLILKNITAISEGKEPVYKEEGMIHDFSLYLYYAYSLLKIYLRYRKITDETKDEKVRDGIRTELIDEIRSLEQNYDGEYALLHEVKKEDVLPWDISLLAKNFLAARLTTPLKNSVLGTL
jgi:hypothetical protein